MEALPVTPKLPQPLRQVTKVLTNLVEKAVDMGEKKRRGRGGAGQAYEETGPAIEPSAHSEPLSAVRCLTLSSDERHLFAGLASGHVVAVSTTTGGTVATLEIGEGPIYAIAQISVRANPISEGGLEPLDEEGGGSEVEGAPCKVLVVAVGERVLFFKVLGVLEDNAFIQFAAAQLPRGTHPEVTKPPPSAAIAPQSPPLNSIQTGGQIKALELAPDAGIFWASAQNGGLAVFPMPSLTPIRETIADVPPVLQLSPLFVLPPGSAAADAGFALSHSTGQSQAISVNAPLLTASNEQLRFLLRSARVREEGGSKSSASSWHCELYVWWEGRNRILMYEVPLKGACSVIKKEAPCEPTKARQWTMPHGVTSGALSADGLLMAVGMGDGTVVLWDLHICLTHRLFQRLEGAITGLAFTGQSAHRPPTGLVVVSSGGELKAHELVGEKKEERPAVAVRKRVTGIACLDGTSKALLFTNDERPAQLIDVSTGDVLGSFAPGEGFVCPKAQQDGTAKERNNGSTEQQSGSLETAGNVDVGTAERQKGGKVERENWLWAFTGGDMLVQIVHRAVGEEERGKAGAGSEEVEAQLAGIDVPSAAGQETSGLHHVSGGGTPSECLVFHSLRSGGLFSHSDSFAGLFTGPQLLERMLHDSASVRKKPGDASTRGSVLPSPRSQPRHVSTTLPPTETPGMPLYPPTMSRHVSIHDTSSDSPRNFGHSSPRTFPYIRQSSLVGVNKPLTLSQASLAAVNKPLPQGQLSLTRQRLPRGSESSTAFTSSPRGDLASQNSPGASPRKGSVKAGRIVGLPVAKQEEEPAASVGYRDDVPAMLGRLSNKGGGRFAREQRMRQRREEMLQELATNKVASLSKMVA